MKLSTIVFRCTMPCIAALFACSDASATLCTPFNAPPPRFVGDTGSDAQCTDNTIQSAIDFVKNAAYACPVTIYITREHLYTSQHLTLSNINTPLTIVGEGDGVHCGSTDVQFCDPSCPPPPTAPLVTIDGSASNNFSVLSITGYNNITLRYLTIKGAAATGDGGGIHFDGSGSLTIDTSTIIQNQANYGGGINFRGNGGAATLTLAANALVLDNIADTSGGGIRIEGTARLFALSPPASIIVNTADSGYGGGLEILGPARADIGTYGLNGAAVIGGNSATYGAGVAVVDNGNGEAVLRTFAHDASHPTVIDNNAGATKGGGIYLHDRADACLYASAVTNNDAADGAGIYYDVSSNVDYDAGFFFNRIEGPALTRLGPNCGPESIATLGGTDVCKPAANCDAVTGNTTEYPNADPSAGSILYIDCGTVVADRMQMRGNLAAHAISFSALDAELAKFYHCLLANNGASDTLIDSGVSFHTLFESCTITHNTIDGAHVIKLERQEDLVFEDDIIDEPLDPLYFTTNFGVGTFTAGYTLLHQRGVFPSDNPSVVTGSPAYVDAGNGDYHLAPVPQTALDFSDYVPVSGLDLDNDPIVDLSAIPNTFGPIDLGAYERQNLFYNCGSSNSIFCDGFDH